MFEDLIQKLDGAIKRLRGLGKITEKNIAESMREIRRVLLEADVNYKVAKDFIGGVQEKALGESVLRSVTPGQQVVKIVHDDLIELLGKANESIHFNHGHVTAIMVVGLQGSGKTTFTGKLGVLLKKQGHQPMLAAADVYRPAAVDQLVQLGESAGISIFTGDRKNPVKIAKNAMSEAFKSGSDVVILDTAGRLHIDDKMMDELCSIRDAVSPAEILFVADGMTGQDAVKSAAVFLEKLDFTGIVLTKMDGDAKGGAALSIRSVTGKPVKFISSGEKLDSLEPFYPDRMASRILGMGDVVSLVEKAQEVVDRDEAEKIAGKIRKQSFSLEDFYDQLQQVKKMGPLSQVMDMLPGGGGKMAGLNVDDNAMKRVEAIIRSMTVEERRKPGLLNGSRKKRIANGSGTSVQDINRLLKQFGMMQKMMKQMNRGKRSMMAGLPFGM
jgi:signal recognition particle subunit SRP54